MAKRYDWPAVKSRYVTGSESMRQMAADESMPSEGTLFRRSQQENWPTARDQYKKRVGEKATEASAQNAADIIAQQLSTGSWLHKTARTLLQGMVQNGVQTLLSVNGKLDPKQLTPELMTAAGVSPTRLIRLLELGVTLEQQVLRDEQQINVRVDEGLTAILEVIERHATPDVLAAILKDLESSART